MTVADPQEIGCAECGAAPGARCRTKTGKYRSTTHRHRWADAGRDDVEPGWIPGDGAVVIDFEAARIRKLAERNGVNLP